MEAKKELWFGFLWVSDLIRRPLNLQQSSTIQQSNFFQNMCRSDDLIIDPHSHHDDDLVMNFAEPEDFPQHRESSSYLSIEEFLGLYNQRQTVQAEQDLQEAKFQPFDLNPEPTQQTFPQPQPQVQFLPQLLTATTPQLTTRTSSSLSSEPNTSETPKQRRDSTSICKIIFTQYKKYLRSKRCPIDMEPYFSVCSYETNHRTLLDFEVTFWFVEQVDRQNPGARLMSQFLEFLAEIKPILINHAKLAYERKRVEKSAKFQEYLERIYRAIVTGRGSDDRMRILYNGMKTPKAMQRLNEILAKF